MYKIILLFLFCLMTDICFSASLSKLEAKAIMSNVTAVMSIEKSKVVIPTPTPPKPTPDSGRSGCANGQCPTTAPSTNTYYEPQGFFRRWR